MGRRGGLLGRGPPMYLGLGTLTGSPAGAHEGVRGPSSPDSTFLGGGHKNGPPEPGIVCDERPVTRTHIRTYTRTPTHPS